MSDAQGHLRIGELSARVGVTPEALRAWERRYGLLKPSRSSGGFRLYSEADETRVRLMQEHLERGLAAAEAARAALSATDGGSATTPIAASEDRVAGLRDALDSFDEGSAHALLDRALTELDLDAVLSDVLLPYLVDLGERWAANEVSVAQEHFASNLVRARLMNLARGWGAGYGPHALLACPEGELHDLALVMFGLALNRRGWRITFLGANTPGTTIEEAAERLFPDLVVVAASNHQRLRAVVPQLREISRARRLAIAGRAASATLAGRCGAEVLENGPVPGAESVARGMPWPG